MAEKKDIENKEDFDRRRYSIDHSNLAFFADSATISHSPAKFIFDFKQTTPRVDFMHGENSQTLVTKHNTLILDPQFVKIFLETLKENLSQFEEKYGKIDLPKKATHKGTKKAGESSHYIG